MNRFRQEYRVLSTEEKLAVAAIKAVAGTLDLHLDAVTDPRAQALARTKLEECVMWAVKGITG